VPETGVLDWTVQLALIWLAPIEAAVRNPASRSEAELVLVSTSRMWQLGHAAETASRSSEISSSQAELPDGIGEAAPAWFTLLKQPLDVVQAGSPYAAR
jgi:hypothetical protein